MINVISLVIYLIFSIHHVIFKSHHRPWDQTNLVLIPIEKVKRVFLLSLMCMFLESTWTKFWSYSFQLQISRILQTRMKQRGGSHENEFWQFSNAKMNITNRAPKVDEKDGFICLVSFFASWVMVLKLSKILHFLQICTDHSKKSKSIKAIYLYPSDLIKIHFLLV